MANVSNNSLELVLFIGVLLFVPIFTHPLEFSSRRLLDHPSPPQTTMESTIPSGVLGAFLEATHEVPSGANPDSNR